MLGLFFFLLLAALCVPTSFYSLFMFRDGRSERNPQYLVINGVSGDASRNAAWMWHPSRAGLMISYLFYLVRRDLHTILHVYLLPFILTRNYKSTST